MHTTLCTAVYRVLSDAVQTCVSTYAIDLKPVYSGVRTLKRYSVHSFHRERSAARVFSTVYIFLTFAYRILPPLINTSTSNQVLEKSRWQLTNTNTAGDTV